jgi:phage head maturation protease
VVVGWCHYGTTASQSCLVGRADVFQTRDTYWTRAQDLFYDGAYDKAVSVGVVNLFGHTTQGTFMRGKVRLLFKVTSTSIHPRGGCLDWG